MKQYQKILVAKYNPKNLCFANDDDMLIIASEKDKFKGKLPKDDYFFVSINNRIPSLYGWVKDIKDNITAIDLFKIDYKSKTGNEFDTNLKIDEKILEFYQNFLEQIDKQKNGTTMVCDWMERMKDYKVQKVLNFHKIVFYKS